MCVIAHIFTIIPVRCPIMCLSKLLNCCLYLSLELCGTAQSLGPVTMGDITEGDEEAELKDKNTAAECTECQEERCVYVP